MQKMRVNVDYLPFVNEFSGRICYQPRRTTIQPLPSHPVDPDYRTSVTNIHYLHQSASTQIIKFEMPTRQHITITHINIKWPALSERELS
jgi:hypothetical protein